MKRTLLVLALASGFAVWVPGPVAANRVVFGRITSVTPTSLSVRDREIVTLTLDARTVYTKLITQKPWQEDTRLTAAALAPGRLVAVHTRADARDVAAWVQIATDVPVEVPGAAPQASWSSTMPTHSMMPVVPGPAGSTSPRAATMPCAQGRDAGTADAK